MDTVACTKMYWNGGRGDYLSHNCCTGSERLIEESCFLLKAAVKIDGPVIHIVKKE